MVDWFSPEMDPEIHIETSEKGFKTNEIAVKWLRHFLKHSDAQPRLMLLSRFSTDSILLRATDAYLCSIPVPSYRPVPQFGSVIILNFVTLPTRIN